jgi:endoglucanase
LLAAQHVFELAKTENVRALTTASPPDYYPETEWRDDMELGAAELYRAMALGGLPADALVFDPLYYLELSGHWAAAYMSSPDAGGELLGLYEVAGLAHRELYLAMKHAGLSRCSEISGAELLLDSSRRLNGAMKQAASDPFGLGLSYTRGELAPNAIGLALEASFYHELSQSETYIGFSQDQTDFLLGRNAWGTSFIVGAGAAYPQCIHHQIANLSGSLDGTPPVLLGATIGGPAPKAELRHIEDEYLDGMQLGGDDAFDVFSGRGSRYLDDVRAWPTVEPTLDYTALTILLFARQASGLD